MILFDPTGEEEKDKPAAQPSGEVWIAASPTGPSVMLSDQYENPSEPFVLRKAFDVAMFGGKSIKAQHRYASLGPDQSIIKRILDRGHGCAACHITTAVHNKYGSAGINPENNLPWDWTLNESGYNNWVAASVVSRAIVTLGTDTAKFGVQLNAPTTFAGYGNRAASRGAARDVS